MIVKILLVEDDEFKRAEVTTYLQELISGAAIDQARSVQSGRRSLVSDDFELVVLDMSLPNFDITSDEHGGSPKPLGGMELLSEIERRDLAVPVIVLTQFPRFEALGSPDDELDLSELDRMLHAHYPRNYRGAVFFDTQGGWRRELETVLNQLFQSGEVSQ